MEGGNAMTTVIQKETFMELARRIKAATTLDDVKDYRSRIDRHYHAGTITASHLGRLDVLIMERIALFES
jgi:hypothetical protein